MMTASDLRTGLAVRIEGAIYKLIEVTHHAGQGKMGGVTHVKLRHLDTGRSANGASAPMSRLTT
jgi:translation elongation factor P/translation initiation factor 5A